MITASAIAIAPSVQPSPTPAQQTARAVPAIQLAAQPFDPVNFLIGRAERVVIPPSAGAPFPTPQFLPMVTRTSVGTTIKDIYNAVEPWVRYGFDLAA